MIEQSFGVQIVHIYCTVFELYTSKKKKVRKKEENRTKSKFSRLISSTVRRINRTLGVHFKISIAKGFHL